MLYLACGATTRRRPLIEQCRENTQRQKSFKYFQPWKVAIVQNNKIMCSGVLISQQWVLTGMQNPSLLYIKTLEATFLSRNCPYISKGSI